MTLAILSPTIGAPSETFIERHVNRLAPGDTCVLAFRVMEPPGGTWMSDAPLRIISGLQETTLTKRLIRTAGLRHLSSNKISQPPAASRRALRSFLVNNHVDVVLAEYLDQWLPVLPDLLDLGVQTYFHGHGYDLSLRLRDPYWRDAYSQLDSSNGVIVPSRYASRRLADIGISPHRLSVIPYGVRIPSQAAEPSTGEFRCLAVGRMVRKKAPLATLEAFRRGLQGVSQMRLDFVGAGPLYEAALRFVARHELEESVQLHGALTNRQVLALMLSSDCFLQHSIVDPETGDEEGLPVAILEAMASGLPVLTTSHAGIPEAVTDGHTGFLVEEGDVEGMARHLIGLAHDRQLGRRLGTAGRERAMEDFSDATELSRLRALMKLDTA